MYNTSIPNVNIIYDNPIEAAREMKISEIKRACNNILSETDYMILRQIENADLYVKTKLSGIEYLELLERREAIRENCRKEISIVKSLNNFFDINMYKFNLE